MRPPTGFDGSFASGSLVVAVSGHAQRDPASAAVIAPESGATLSFADLARESRVLAGRIRSVAAPGQTVVLAAPNGPPFVCGLLAGFEAGVRVLLIHPRSPAGEVARLADCAGARVIVSASTHVPGLSPVPAAAVGDGGCAAAVTGGAAVLPSSGTTGVPKLVLREGPALEADAANLARALEIGPGDRVLAAMPLGHSYGLDVTLAALWSGATIVTHAEFDVAAVGASLETGVSVFPAVPFMIEALARVGTGGRPPALRLVITAGTPLTAAVRAAFEAAWRIPVGQLYGATELGSVTLSDPGKPGFAAASVGTPFPGVSIRILDPDDPRIQRGAGEEGHVAVAARSMLSGYLDDDVPLVDGHFLTGDLGRLDDSGRLYITGRLKLLVDVGGLKVNPLEVETVLRDHPAVADCVVVPLPLSETVTRLRAVYTARSAASADELRLYLKERLAPHKVPRVFQAVTALPRSPAGKILRQEVASL